MTDVDIMVLVGSWSADSQSPELARDVMDYARRQGVKMSRTVDAANLPHFSRDLELHAPTSVVDEKKLVDRASRLLIVSPVHNSLLPGAVLNYLDWMSRPWGESCLTGLPVSLFTVGQSATPPNSDAIATTLSRIGALPDRRTWLHTRAGDLLENVWIDSVDRMLSTLILPDSQMMTPTRREVNE